MEQIFFLVLIALVGLVRWIIQAAEEKKNAEAAKRAAPKQEPNAPIERAPAQSEEERIRRFMEALGVPTTAAPPPQPPPREVQPKKPREPKRKVMPVDPFPVPRTRLPEPPPPVVTTPPPVVVAPPPLPEPVPVLSPATTVLTTPVPTAAQRTAPEFEVAEIDWQFEESTQTGSATSAAAVVRQDVVSAERSWAARLATPESARDAIVLREIFGAPRSMQAADERALG